MQPIIITSGEPAGIGPDICLELADTSYPVVIAADKHLLQQRATQLGKNVRLYDYHPNQPFRQPETNGLAVLHIPLSAPCTAGELNPANAAYVLQLLDTAYQGIATQQFSAMVTAPLHKGIINDADPKRFFSGHTEYLAELSHTDHVVMMLAGGGLRVALLTTHLPLKDVPAAITTERINTIARILHQDLVHKFGIAQPRILLAGLNPHAGENGHLGHEERDIMQPAAAALRHEGINISDPLPADTLFQPFMLQDADAILAAYHDQGLPVLKYASFGHGINITLGLPFIRTSVDHGTALSLAGSGRADSGSLKAALQTAVELAQQQTNPAPPPTAPASPAF